MRIPSVITRTAVLAATGLVLLTGCGGTGDSTGRDGSGTGARDDVKKTALRTIPQVGPALRDRIPHSSRQVVAVYGKGVDSADSTVVLYTRHGAAWQESGRWPAHNGKRGWTTDHHEGDKRSPVGVFTLTDAGGVNADPKSRLPYTRSAAFAAPHYWPKTHWHDFDYVIAIDYNRVKGRPPIDPTRPEGQSKGGSIWLHMDHGSGTSACVSLSKSGMAHLLRTLDPDQHPVVVMGDKAGLAG